MSADHDHGHAVERVGEWKSRKTRGGHPHPVHPILQPHHDSAEHVTTRPPIATPPELASYLATILGIENSWRSRKKWRPNRSPEQQALEPFVRAVETILDSSEFARLRGVMQVLSGDDVHNRQSHSVGTAIIAYKVAIDCGLNVPLAVAAALAHDIGHLPMGHSGEYGMRRVAGRVPEVPGNKVDHGLLGRFVVLLQRAFAKLPTEVLDAAGFHTWSLRTGRTNEADLISIADRDYVGSDLGDGLIRGFIRFNQLPRQVAELCGFRHADVIAGKYSPSELHQALSQALVDETILNYERFGLVGLSEAFSDKFLAVRDFNGEHLLPEWRIKWQGQISALIGDAVEHLAGNPRFLDSAVAQGRLDPFPSDASPLSRALRVSLTWSDKDALDYAENEMGRDTSGLREGLPLVPPGTRTDRGVPGEAPRAPLPIIPGDLPPVDVTIIPARRGHDPVVVKLPLCDVVEVLTMMRAAHQDRHRIHVIKIWVGERQLLVPGPAHGQYAAARRELVSAVGRGIERALATWDELGPEARAFLDKLGVNELVQRPVDPDAAHPWDVHIVGLVLEHGMSVGSKVANGASTLPSNSTLGLTSGL